MAVTKPEIDDLLAKTDENPFLLCSIASKRACDLNNMIRRMHLRVAEDTVSVAMQEVVDGTLSFAKEDFEAEIKGSNELVEHNR